MCARVCVCVGGGGGGLSHPLPSRFLDGALNVLFVSLSRSFLSEREGGRVHPFHLQ